MLKRLSLPLLVFLTACSSMPQIPVSDAIRQQTSWAEQQHSWSLSGRIAITSSDESGQADLFWNQQSPQQYSLKMVTPFGGGTTQLNVSADGAAVTLADGKTYYADSLQELLSQSSDWVLPVDAVRYWLFALPAPGIPVQKLELNQQQLPQYLEQSDWKIRFKSYHNIDGHWLPGKLFMQQTDLEQNRIDVRVVIRQRQGLQ